MQARLGVWFEVFGFLDLGYGPNWLTLSKADRPGYGSAAPQLLYQEFEPA